MDFTSAGKPCHPRGWPGKCGSLTQGFAGAASDMALMKAQGPVLKMFSRTLSPCDISVDRNGRTRARSSVHNHRILSSRWKWECNVISDGAWDGGIMCKWGDGGTRRKYVHHNSCRCQLRTCVVCSVHRCRGQPASRKIRQSRFRTVSVFTVPCDSRCGRLVHRSSGRR